METPPKPAPAPAALKPERTLGYSPHNALIHAHMVNYVYDTVSDWKGTVSAPRMRQSERYLDSLGFKDVRVFHNPDGVTALAYRDPQTNMMFVTFPGTDNAKKGLSIASSVVRHAIGWNPKVESPIGGTVDRVFMGNLHAKTFWLDRLNGIEPQTTSLVEQLYEHISNVSSQAGTPEKPLQVSVGGHSLGATHAPYFAAELTVRAKKEGHGHLTPGVILLAPVNSTDPEFAKRLQTELKGNIHRFYDKKDIVEHINTIANQTYGYVPLANNPPIESCKSQQAYPFQELLDAHDVQLLKCGITKPKNTELEGDKISGLQEADPAQTPQSGIPVAYKKSQEQRVGVV